MADIRKAAQQALEALTYYRDDCSGAEPSISLFHQKLEGAVASLESALSQLAEVQGEPSDFQLEQIFDAVHQHGEFGRGFREDARAILRAPAAHPVQVPNLYERIEAAHDASLDDDHRACRVILCEIMSQIAAAPLPPAQTESSHVGDSNFESWFSAYNPAGKSDKQRARDAYAAGLSDHPAQPVNRRLLEALKASLATLKRANENPFGPIYEMIWHTECETLFDFMDAAIAEAEAQPKQEAAACPHRDEPRGCYRVRCQLGRKCVAEAEAQPVGLEPLSRQQKDAICVRAEAAMAANCNLSWREALINETQRELGITGKGV